ncbi:GntR family transcriptional regulator [Streptomyces sp. NPDC055692]|uniref:GntR family transcriptional regulator n=1 Tax=Streptomyces sp. NPDC055692 TaxID=3155683 RepID=UPI00341BBF83
MSPDLDRSRPIWKQIAAIVEQRIEDGIYGPGSRVPGLHELAAEFGVAVSTIQKALAHLKTLGLIRSELGLGTYVLTPEERQQQG